MALRPSGSVRELKKADGAAVVPRGSPFTAVWATAQQPYEKLRAAVVVPAVPWWALPSARQSAGEDFVDSDDEEAVAMEHHWTSNRPSNNWRPGQASGNWSVGFPRAASPGWKQPSGEDTCSTCSCSSPDRFMDVQSPGDSESSCDTQVAQAAGVVRVAGGSSGSCSSAQAVGPPASLVLEEYLAARRFARAGA
eukprot:TRINITY_DN76409_c0_g1_i1.p1 TRINITY_DN76409_c0_g1~~TRINITY_DN76409_c0_g1_i1.p1  ORF type:complete len:194 (+),score=42.71 TRINITY_DN76409_c0_g1_i1:101-682(+)